MDKEPIDEMNDEFQDEEYLDFGTTQDEEQLLPNQSDETAFEGEPDDDPTDGPSDHIFVFKGEFYRRLYRGQQRPREFCKQTVEGDSLENIFDCIWDVSKPQIQRQVVFEGDVPRWSKKQHPDRKDIDRFVTLYDQAKKKTYNTPAITPRVLATWRGKSIKIHVFDKR